ncbi:magnesium-transporting ATPase (P-type) [Pseudorhizobium tarimense]|uniref:Magnesium-transporting ATPase (P-type) n=1 Tax=Pseudorhizobium tarimense TaxID=1079109 RepID=A0ABV2H0J2_9HYPH
MAEDAALGDRHSMLWSGTLVTQGTARGLVVATGQATEIGRIGGLLARVEQITTPLVQQMDHFARWLSFLILLAAALLLAYAYFVGHRDFAETFMVILRRTDETGSLSDICMVVTPIGRRQGLPVFDLHAVE